jgi:hypothetical protein
MSGTLKVGGKTLATHDTAANEISFHSDVMATTAQVQGVHTTSTVSIGSASLTINSFVSGSSVSNGDYVVGEGITPGTTVSSGGGTTSITLSANAGATLSTDPVSFYTANKALSPGLVAGGLCRAWVSFNESNVIQSSFNVSSVSGSSGNHTISFLTNLPDTKYVVVGFIRSNFATPNSVHAVTAGADDTKSTSQVQIRQFFANASSAGTFSHSECNILIFR